MSVETPATDQAPQVPTALTPLEGQSAAPTVLHRALPQVGWIGTGIMGQSMAGHLLKAGYPLHVYNRSKQKAQALIEAGAQWHDDPISLEIGRAHV